jgi:hypothetical protein
MERIESKSIISIFTILYTRLIFSANRSNDKERKRSKNVALSRRTRERECGFFFASFMDVCKRKKTQRRRKSSSINHRPLACSSTTHCYRSLVVVKLKQARRRKRERKLYVNRHSTLFFSILNNHYYIFSN